MVVKFQSFILIVALTSCQLGSEQESGKGLEVKQRIENGDTRIDTSLFPINSEKGSDSTFLKKAIDSIFHLPEVVELGRRIEANSKGQHGVAVITSNEFNGDSSSYLISVGDNSSKERFVTVFMFLVSKKSGKIDIYDQLLDSVRSLAEWRLSH